MVGRGDLVVGAIDCIGVVMGVSWAGVGNFYLIEC